MSSQIIAIAIGAVLSSISSSSPEAIRSLSRTGLVLNFESLLSEAGSEVGMLADYAFGAHFVLEHTRFVLTPDISELKMEGDRQSPRVYIPCPQSLLQSTFLIDMNSNGQSHCSAVTFSVIPVMFNVGINEKQEIQGTTFLCFFTTGNGVKNQRALSTTPLYLIFIGRLKVNQYTPKHFTHHIQHKNDW